MIIVMDNGKIVETGDHEKLLKRSGHYSALFKAQNTKITN
jgi:ABC-type multidrug transport system fused ATPase/permease subunit